MVVGEGGLEFGVPWIGEKGLGLIKRCIIAVSGCQFILTTQVICVKCTFIRRHSSKPLGTVASAPASGAQCRNAAHE